MISPYIAGTISILGHHSRYVVASFLGRHVVAILICAAVVIGLLAGPVLGESLSHSFSTGWSRAAPVAFSAGLGILLMGLIAGVRILDIAGACLAGAVLLGTIMVNY